MIIKLDISNTRTGGRIYENKVVDILKEKYKKEFKHIIVKKNRNHFYSILRFIYLYVWLKIFYSGTLILTGATPYFAGIRSKNILILHHFENKSVRSLIGLYIRKCEKYILTYKNKYSLIICVSEYWSNYFKKLGFKNVKIIYNWFDIDEYKSTEQEINAFKIKYSIPNLPIVYIGNAQINKGASDVISKIEHKQYYIVTSGKARSKLTVRNLNLSFKEYITLLKAASVTILMSKFPEGWNRIAHESILMKTPVIGSGMGGMRELLTHSGQTICENIEDLPKMLNDIFEKSPINMQKAYAYAASFTLSRFTKEWNDIEL